MDVHWQVYSSSYYRGDNNYCHDGNDYRDDDNDYCITLSMWFHID